MEKFYPRGRQITNTIGYQQARNLKRYLSKYFKSGFHTDIWLHPGKNSDLRLEKLQPYLTYRLLVLKILTLYWYLQTPGTQNLSLYFCCSHFCLRCRQCKHDWTQIARYLAYLPTAVAPQLKSHWSCSPAFPDAVFVRCTSKTSLVGSFPDAVLVTVSQRCH